MPVYGVLADFVTGLPGVVASAVRALEAPAA
jgi:hypothetical protein